MRINLSAAIAVALLSTGSFGWAHAQESDYFRPISLEVIEAGATSAPCELKAAPGCAAPAEAGCAAAAAPTCGADQGCGAGGCGNDCCAATGWFANVEAVFLVSDRRGDDALVGIADVLGQSINTYGRDLGSLEDNVMSSPRATIGFQGECWGIQTRFWHLNDTATSFDPLLSIPLANDPIGSSSVDRLKMYTIDLEVTRQFCWRNWNMLGSAGVRYGSWESDFRVTAIENIQIVNLTTATALAGTEFKGTGITGALGGTREVNCCTGLNWFWNARGSYLFGRHESFAEVTGASVDLTGSVLTDNVAFAAADGNTFIGELQLGAQWEHELKCVNARAFIRIAGEFQYWSGEDVASAVAIGLGATNVGAYVGEAAAGDPSMSLIGVSLGAGITY